MRKAIRLEPMDPEFAIDDPEDGEISYEVPEELFIRYAQSLIDYCRVQKELSRIVEEKL
jgi:hypothetical protein